MLGGLAGKLLRIRLAKPTNEGQAAWDTAQGKLKKRVLDEAAITISTSDDDRSIYLAQRKVATWFRATVGGTYLGTSYDGVHVVKLAEDWAPPSPEVQTWLTKELEAVSEDRFELI